VVAERLGGEQAAMEIVGPARTLVERCGGCRRFGGEKGALLTVLTGLEEAVRSAFPGGEQR